MIDLFSIVPELARRIPFLNIAQCDLEIDGKTYEGLALVHPEPQEGNRVQMVTLAIVDDQLVLGIHSQERQTDMSKSLADVDEAGLVSTMCLAWNVPQPN